MTNWLSIAAENGCRVQILTQAIAHHPGDLRKS